MSALSTATQAFRPVSSVTSIQRHYQPSLVVLQSSSSSSTTKQQQQSQNRKPVDWKRAKHCAEHFGACDVEEVEQLHAGKETNNIESFQQLCVCVPRVTYTYSEYIVLH
jgi:hypothetical protein